MANWISWHEQYDTPESSLAQRLAVVRLRIAEALDRCAPGPIRAVSMCAGDGRDLLGVLETHPRAADVNGLLVELDAELAERARNAAPPRITVACRDAGESDAYADAAPADLLLCCGVFGNISDEDIRATLLAWPLLCAPGATVIWTRGAFKRDIRDDIRRWIEAAGFMEMSFDGPPRSYGVGAAKLVREPIPYRTGVRFFTFVYP